MCSFKSCPKWVYLDFRSCPNFSNLTAWLFSVFERFNDLHFYIVTTLDAFFSIFRCLRYDTLHTIFKFSAFATSLKWNKIWKAMIKCLERFQNRWNGIWKSLLFILIGIFIFILFFISFLALPYTSHRYLPSLPE